ncbi:MAG TPA: TlpA disulfide reductase family protein [Candidatus Cybelea sp.]|nr:TlpA disulfide reductase family protein [Candidatus Cybelea sp.]
MQRYLPWAGVFVVLAVAAAVAAPYFFSQPANVNGPSSAAGRPAPVFTLRDDLGRRVSLTQYRGSIVVMNLWASWCPPCRAEMPDLQKLADSYGPRGVEVVGINEGESPQRARAFAGSLGIRFPIWIDSAEQYGRTYTALGLPTTVIVDRRGVVVRGFDGALTLDQMRAAVAAATHST